MSNQVDPKDPNLAMAFTLQIAAMAIKLRNIAMHITANPGMLDDNATLKMAEALQRVERASDALRSDLIIERKSEDKPQEWGPCPKCGGPYRFETLGAYGMDAFKVTKIICTRCEFNVVWQDDPDGSAPDAWKMQHKIDAMNKKIATQKQDERDLKR